MDLSTLVKMSNTYGSNPAYVLAGGGNTSVKRRHHIVCKRLWYTACYNQVRGICGNEQSTFE